MKLKRKIGFSVLVFLTISLMSIGGCGLNREMGSSKEHEVMFEHVLAILQTVKNAGTECGLFDTNDKTAGKYYKRDISGGTYKLEKVAFESGSGVFKYNFSNYTGNLKMADEKVVKLTGFISGVIKHTIPEKIRLKGALEVFHNEVKVGSVHFKGIQINNGKDGANCGKLQSLELIDTHGFVINDELLVDLDAIAFFNDQKPEQKLELKVKDIESSAKEKALWQKFIAFQD